ncbi:helix-turn-helix domain-containing protein [Halobacteria archaeon AArc-curdl1]|uniref:Helix-turn-helix domain-containing protein n=1 Tax=Natronosalvus hydrolyticus TaxID=2979988 RepID=A0AAP2Z7T9_9EURY|nr:helix-turn-helix domain-containing protein [Halobacteria archaeon AArc-curdl1]
MSPYGRRTHGVSCLFENDRRRTIYETIYGDPGLCLSAVSTGSGVPLSTVRHHVRVLEDENVIQSVTVCGKRRYFPVDWDNVEERSMLFEPAKGRVLEALAVLGTSRNVKLATVLDCDSSTVSHHLETLEDAGFVRRERDGRSIVNELDPAIKSIGSGLGMNLETEAAAPLFEAEVA